MRYMVSRQVQNESSGCVWRSASPAMARWKACECRLAMPGSCQPASTWRTRGAGVAGLAGMAERSGGGCDRLPRRRQGRSDPCRAMPSTPRCRRRPPTLAAERWDGLLVNARLATLDAADGYGLVDGGALGWSDGRIAYVGTVDALPGPPDALAG